MYNMAKKKIQKTRDTHVLIAIIAALIIGILFGIKAIQQPVTTGSDAATMQEDLGGGAQLQGLWKRIKAVKCAIKASSCF